MGLGELLLNPADGQTPLQSLLNIKSGVADPSDDKVDLLEGQIGLQLFEQLLQVGVVGRVVQVRLTLHPNESDGFERLVLDGGLHHGDHRLVKMTPHLGHTASRWRRKFVVRLRPASDRRPAIGAFSDDDVIFTKRLGDGGCE